MLIPRQIAAFRDAILAVTSTSIPIPGTDPPIVGLPGIRDSTRIQYNQHDFQELDREHEYRFMLPGGKLLEVSVQLYMNDRDHWRLFAYSVVDRNDSPGMLFSVNLTVGQDDSEMLALRQRIMLPNRALTRQTRSEAADALATRLRGCGLTVTEDHDIVFSSFDTRKKAFIGTTAAAFIRDFVVAAVIKGPYMENKGYVLPWLDESAQPARSTSEFTSSALTVGKAYSRLELRALFGIKDATINNGTFHAKPASSVWLFITENKTADRTQYEDFLEGDVLRMEGQTEGKTDALLIDHLARGLELLLFYRKSKTERPHGAFVYEGPFDYVSHEGTRPTRFILRRHGTAVAASIAETRPAFDPDNWEDARQRATADVVQRPGQSAFRDALIKAYDGRCAVTPYDFPGSLAAAHIVPHRGEHTDRVENGLLLRADIHVLFDRGLLAVDVETMRVLIAPILRGTAYGALEGVLLRVPKDPDAHPNKKALDDHRRKAGL